MYKGQFFDHFSKYKHGRDSKFNYRLNFYFQNQGIILLQTPVFWAILAKFGQL